MTKGNASLTFSHGIYRTSSPALKREVRFKKLRVRNKLALSTFCLPQLTRRVGAEIYPFLQRGVKLLKIDHSSPDFSDSKFTVQIISKERQTKFSAVYLLRCGKISGIHLNYSLLKILYATHLHITS